MRKSSCDSIRKAVQTRCARIFEDDDAINSTTMTTAMEETAEIVVKEMKNVLRVAMEVEDWDEWNKYDFLEESNLPNKEYYVQILPKDGFDNTQLSFCMYLWLFTRKFVCVCVVSDVRKILPICASFPPVTFEDFLRAEPYSPEQGVDDLIGKKVLFTQDNAPNPSEKLDNWEWRVVAGKRGERVIVCDPTQKSLGGLESDLPKIIKTVSDASRLAAKRVLKRMEMKTIEDVTNFEKKYGEMTRDMFSSREGFSLFTRARKIMEECDMEEDDAPEDDTPEGDESS